MGKRVFRLGLLMVVAFFASCQDEHVRNRLEGPTNEEVLDPAQNRAEVIVREIRYIKDASTNLCFAYYWGGSFHGGPSLATVPCEAIPPHLLTVSR